MAVFIPAAISRILTSASEILFLLSFLVSVAYFCGWIHRLLWFLTEHECKKALNGTRVTIGSLRFDLLRGRLYASNVIIHAPRRDKWKWDSPVLARVGRAYVEANVMLCILSLWFLREELPVDIYTVAVSDIQVFVERRQNFFNLFLLDPLVEQPEDPSILFNDDDVQAEDESVLEEDDSENVHDQHHDDDKLVEILEGSSNLEAYTSSMDMTVDDTVSSTQPQHQLMPPEEKAQLLMDNMLRAISRAAKEGSLQGALVEQRQNITSQLKALKSTKKSEAMEEGVKIVQHVSKAVVEKTQTVQQVVQPVRRQQHARRRIVMVRVGRIRIRDCRIFTRDYGNGKEAGTDNKGKATPLQQKKSVQSKSRSSWNKPIVIRRVDIRASELCPSFSVKDENDLPAIHQPIECCIEVVWRRVLAEAAKSNTGRLFSAAIGEVVDYWMEKKNVEI